jgi:squalene-hopene/tetraprenyl-beta-curcumene cyclase
MSLRPNFREIARAVPEWAKSRAPAPLVRLAQPERWGLPLIDSLLNGLHRTEEEVRSKEAVALRERLLAASRAVRVDDRAPDATTVDAAIASARDHLLSLQKGDGEWCAYLEGDTILESEYSLTMWFLGRGEEIRVKKAAESIRRHQLEGGGWAIFPDGPIEVSASVKAYFVLKLAGDDPASEPMVRARDAILRAGGIQACNSYTKVFLSIFGQYEWEDCPAIPPELILFPSWFPFTIYEMSSWSRAIVVPLSIVWAMKPRCSVPASANISELYADHVVGPTGVRKYLDRINLWTHFFALTDRVLKVLEKSGIKPFRRLALQHSEKWIRERLVKSDGVAAIIPPILNTIIGFRAMGYGYDDPDLAGQIAQLERLEVEGDELMRIQPCFSAVWDTSQVLNSILAAGVAPDDPDVLESARWLLAHEVREAGDWQKKVKGIEPGGWYFEYANEWYPDCDDTAEVLMALHRVRFPDPEEEAAKQAAMDRGLRWLLAMQNSDGGWAAFDRGCHHEFLNHVPFADHNAMLDPSCEDITGRVLEALRELGFDRTHPSVRKALRFLRARQEKDGTWYGRWGNNYIYGTWLAVTGMHAMDPHVGTVRMQRAAAWMRSCQNPDGGWGESLHSYDHPEIKGCGESTAAQTSWALLALFAAGDRDSTSVRRGLAYLLGTQRDDGSWYDEPWTGTGFPRVFYLRYHLYATQFPLLALAAYQDLDDPSGAAD